MPEPEYYYSFARAFKPEGMNIGRIATSLNVPEEKVFN
jgi:hypothetical protein